MENYGEALNEQLSELKRLLRQSEKNLKMYKDLPDVRVIASRSNGCDQFYFKTKSDGKPKYAKTEERKLVESIVQREYEFSVNRQLNMLCRSLERFLKSYDVDSIDGIYAHTCEAKRKLIKPLISTEEQYVNEWREAHPGSQNSFQSDILYETNRGESVRSKSEKILADLFYKHEIPYVYEPKLFLSDGIRVFCPDFALLNVRKRKTFIWEHLGMCSDAEYAIKNLGKIRLYEDSGYKLGDDLLISIEAEGMPLDVKKIEEKIMQYLK